MIGGESLGFLEGDCDGNEHCLFVLTNFKMLVAVHTNRKYALRN